MLRFLLYELGRFYSTPNPSKWAKIWAIACTVDLFALVLLYRGLIYPFCNQRAKTAFKRNYWQLFFDPNEGDRL